MTVGCPTGLEERILVLLPLQEDAQTLDLAFQGAGLECVSCTDLAHLCREMETGAATLVLTEEQLQPPHAEPLLHALATQPRWSDIPVLVLLRSSTESPAVGATLQQTANVVLLGRPIHPGQLVTAARSALRARQRQYQMRDYLAEHQQAEARVQRQARLIELSPAATIVYDAEDRITFWSAGAHRLYGWTPQEAMGHNPHEWLRTEFSTPLADILKELRRHRKWSGELRHRAKDGRIVVVESHWLGQFSAAGELVEVLESNMDVTQRKQAEALLRSTLRGAELERSRLAAVLEALPAGVAIADAQGKIIQFNAAMTRIWGAPPTPKGITEYSHWRGRFAETGQPLAAEDWAMAKALRTGQPVAPKAVRIEKFNGAGTASILNAAAPIRNPAGEVIGAVVAEIDVTEQTRAEEALQRRHWHLQILHRAAAGLLLGRAPLDLLHGLHEAIARTCGTDIFMFYEAEPQNGQMRLRASAGLSEAEQHKLEALRFGCAVCAKRNQPLKPVVATDLQSSTAPNQRLVRKLGWQAYLYFPLVLEGRLQSSLAFASRTQADYDATDLEFFHTIAGTIAEALERHRLQSELQHHTVHLEHEVQERTARLRETVAELEGFSYSLVHDMRAPLRAMLVYADILAMEAGTELKPEAADLLRKISIAARRMDQLVTDSLNYSRILSQNLPLHPVNLGALLRGMVETYPNLQAPQAEVSLDLDDIQVYGNEAALTQVFSNLLGNAVKFVAPGVRPKVHVWAEPAARAAEKPEAAPHARAARALTSAARSSPKVCICVQDNGIGIAREAHEKIFDMFQRMHRAEEYPGTGIGLALVKKSLERNGGEISVESTPGRGSRFYVTLPRAHTPEPPAKSSPG